jgi:hypothetical protein
MKSLSRPTALKFAATLSFLNGVSGLVMSLSLIGHGKAQLDQVADSPPYVVVVSGLICSILHIIGAYGTWNRRRWGIVLTLLVSAVGALLAVPGVGGAPTPELRLLATFSVVADIVTCILCLWRDLKLAPTT